MLNYRGLRKRPTYDGVVDYLEHHQEIIKYPNRNATRIMASSFEDDMLGTYNQQKQMRKMVIINMLNGDQSTQTDFERENGVQVNLKIIKNNTKINLQRAIGT